ncbi:MAG: hypothetical protein M3X11_23760 [Acidobacteriota bacterium]|nr:hypothetical protein [Acidobacteriota bacterium]
MSKQFKKLSQAEQEAMELEYHQMRPEDFDEQMKLAEWHVPQVVRLSPQLAEALQSMAEAAGEPGYQEMVKRWIEERLQQESMAVGAH